MEPTNQTTQAGKRKLKLYERPWLSLLAVIAAIILANFLSIIILFVLLGLSPDSTNGQFALGISYQVLTVFIIIPFVLQLPKGKRPFRQYLDDIGLTRMKPFGRLLLLAVSCYFILALSQVAASLLFRYFEGLPINWHFIREVVDISGDLPPASPSLLVSLPSIFEEMTFRGVVLVVFLRKYSQRQSILYSAIGFGLVHLLNLASGRELVWVLSQVVWALLLGLFYGYLFVKTRSLWPAMVVHYLGNAFIGSLTGYLQSRASIETQAIYGVILSMGMVPSVLMILWTRFFSRRWLPGSGSSAAPG